MSKLVPNLKPSSSSRVSLMFGSGNGLRLRRSFSLRKSVMKRTVSSFFGIIVLGDWYSELFTFLSTPILHSRLISTICVALFFTGTGYGLHANGFAFGSRSSSLCWKPFHFPTVPSNKRMCLYRMGFKLRSTSRLFHRTNECVYIEWASSYASVLQKDAGYFLIFVRAPLVHTLHLISDLRVLQLLLLTRVL